MGYLLEEIDYMGHTIRIEADEDHGYHDGPRSWSNVGTMVCAHRHYRLGDEQADSMDHFEVECEACDDGDDCKTCGGYGYMINPVEWAKQRGATVVLELGLYDHSGISMYVSRRLYPTVTEEGGHPCPWDSGAVGILFDTPEGVEECGTPPERIEEVLRNEVEVYDQYLRGDVVGYVVEDGVAEGRIGDSCWGYYDRDQAIEDAKSHIDWAIENEAEQAAKIAKMMAL